MPRRIYTRAFASVRFGAPDLDPLLVTNSLRLPPDTQHRRGEPRISRRKDGSVHEYTPYREGQWSMSSERWVNSPLLETHLKWLLAEIEPRAEAIRSLDVHGLMIDFFCFSEGVTPTPPSLPKDIISRSDALGIRIVIDHYDSSNDSEPA